MSSYETFNNTKYTKQSWIALLSFLSIAFQSSSDTPTRVVIGLIATHCSQSTRRFPILSFQSSKFWPLNFWIPILYVLYTLTIHQFYVNSHYKRYLFNPRQSQTLKNKGVTMHPNTTLIPNFIPSTNWGCVYPLAGWLNYVLTLRYNLCCKSGQQSPV